MKSRLQVTMPDGSVWTVPVGVIAHHRAKHYAEEFGGDVARSLKEDTIPLFTENHYAVMDWARNNMNWSDVASSAWQRESPKPDFQEGWVNGEMKVLP